MLLNILVNLMISIVVIIHSLRPPLSLLLLQYIKSNKKKKICQHTQKNLHSRVPVSIFHQRREKKMNRKIFSLFVFGFVLISLKNFLSLSLSLSLTHSLAFRLGYSRSQTEKKSYITLIKCPREKFLLSFFFLLLLLLFLFLLEDLLNSSKIYI